MLGSFAFSFFLFWLVTALAERMTKCLAVKTRGCNERVCVNQNFVRKFMCKPAFSKNGMNERYIYEENRVLSFDTLCFVMLNGVVMM